MNKSVSLPATSRVAEQKTLVVTPDIDERDTNAEIVSGLASYLSRLGGGNANLAKVTSLLEALQGEEWRDTEVELQGLEPCTSSMP